MARAVGRIWFSPRASQAKAGVYCLAEDGSNWTCVVPDTKGSCFAGTGNIAWIGTPDGLVRYDTVAGRRQSFTTRDGLVASSVSSVAMDRRSVWIGTPFGISRLDEGVFERR